MARLTKEDLDLVDRAWSYVKEQAVRGGVVGEVGCALVTEEGEVFVGKSLDLVCGIGFCAEHTAIAQMITQTGGTAVRTIVACNGEGPIPPCGRCRELMHLLDARNMEADVIISRTEKVRLGELLPRTWEPRARGAAAGLHRRRETETGL